MNKHFNLITLAVIAGLAGLLFAGVGVTGAAAHAAIPGDALYPVKMTIEQTRLSMAGDAGDRAQMKMDFAEQRLNEITRLIEEGRYREINDAVLAFETDINGALLELDTLSKLDPARSASLAQEITTALTRYAQTLSSLVASAPDNVRSEVTRALTSANTASSLEMPDGSLDDNSNGNSNEAGDDHGSGSSIDDNSNANDNGSDDDGSANGNSNEAGDDHGSNSSIDDNSNANDNGSDDDGSANVNSNSNDNSDDDSNTNVNDNSNSSIDDNSNANDNTNTNDNSNSNSDDSGSNSNNSGGGSDNGNNNGDDSGGNSGKGGG